MASNKPHFVPSADPASIVVPGVDPTLPPAVQIEQIDQLITDRLASIDNNMAKAHQILTTQILPSVQRFAQATQPTRDAARFWKSFFELAAQVRVPEGDYSQIEPELETEEHEAHLEEHDETSGGAEETGNETVTEQTTLHAHQRDQPATQMTPSSFLSAPGQSGVEHSFSNVVSSTPARPQHTGHGDVSQISMASTDVPAWSPSHGSLVSGPGAAPPSNVQSGMSATAIKATKAAASLLTDFSFSSSSGSSAFQPPSPSTDGTSQSTSSFEMGVPVPQRPKGKGKASDLRQKVLRRNSKGGTGPGTPKLSKYNPFQPSAEDGGKWNGLVDLNTSHSLSSDTSSVIPDFAKISFSSSSADSPSRDSATAMPGTSRQQLQPPTAQQLWSDTSSNASSVLRFPPPNKDLVRIAATPSKKAADLLVKDLLAGFDFEDSPGPSEAVPTPPRPTYTSRPRQSYRPVGSAGPRPSVIQAFKSGRLKDDDDDFGGGGGRDDFDDDSDSFEDEGAEGYEAQGSQLEVHPGGEDDSFDSEDMSFNDGGGGGRASVEGGGNDFTDFTDFGGGGGGGAANDDTDTLFGPRGNPPPPRTGFRLEGPHTTRIQMQLGHPDAMAGLFSPTPFSGDYVDLDRRGR